MTDPVARKLKESEEITERDLLKRLDSYNTAVKAGSEGRPILYLVGDRVASVVALRDLQGTLLSDESPATVKPATPTTVSKPSSPKPEPPASSPGPAATPAASEPSSPKPTATTAKAIPKATLPKGTDVGLEPSTPPKKKSWFAKPFSDEQYDPEN